jgi:hypothetical protein
LISLTLLTVLLSICGCSSGGNPVERGFVWQELSGRDGGGADFSRDLIYRAKVPIKWRRLDPSVGESIFDTMKANCEFTIEDSKGDVRVVVHNFPSALKHERIPPMAQVSRWKRQFSILEAVSLREDPYAHGGFAGTFFEASGLIEGKRQAFIGIAMQLDSEHFQVLRQDQGSDSELRLSYQKCADYTIKASGSPESIDKHRREIQVFARSFELIEEIPERQ